MNILQLFAPVRVFIFDIDGVLTDGTVIPLPGGVQARRMSVKDGYALQLAIKKGYRIIVVSGADTPEVKDRLLRLGVTEVHLSVHNKVDLVKTLIEGTDSSTVLFMGDDMPDLPMMSFAGLPCCPIDAIVEVRTAAKYISPVKGGEGCVRDVIEKVLKLNDHWSADSGIASR